MFCKRLATHTAKQQAQRKKHDKHDRPTNNALNAINDFLLALVSCLTHFLSPLLNNPCCLFTVPVNQNHLVWCVLDHQPVNRIQIPLLDQLSLFPCGFLSVLNVESPYLLQQFSGLLMNGRHALGSFLLGQIRTMNPDGHVGELQRLYFFVIHGNTSFRYIL